MGCRRVAKLSLLDKAQNGLRENRVNMLSTSVLMGTSRKLIVMGNGAKNQIPRFYGKTYFTMLNRYHPRAKKYMKRVHKVGHKGISSTLHRSRQHFWIIEKTG
jgi:hypothetical protein